MKRFHRYRKRKGLELNSGKIKVMVLKKSSRERSQKINLKWDDSIIEVVKELCYLGFNLSEDISNKKQTQHLAGKAKAVIDSSRGEPHAARTPNDTERDRETRPNLRFEIENGGVQLPVAMQAPPIKRRGDRIPGEILQGEKNRVKYESEVQARKRK